MAPNGGNGKRGVGGEKDSDGVAKMPALGTGGKRAPRWGKRGDKGLGGRVKTQGGYLKKGRSFDPTWGY